MRISHKNKFIFLAYPRTASRSIRKLLDPYTDIFSVLYEDTSKVHPFYHHITAQEVKEQFEVLNWDFNDYYSFCFIRNPFERVKSLYRLSSKTRETNKKTILSMDEFIKKNLEKVFLEKERKHSKKFLMISPIKYFAYDNDGNKLVNKIYKQEELSLELENISEKLKLNLNERIPIVGVEEKKEIVLSNYAKDIISEVYEYDFKTYYPDIKL